MEGFQKLKELREQLDKEMKKSREQIKRVIKNNSYEGFLGHVALDFQVIAHSVGARDSVLNTPIEKATVKAFDEVKKDQ